MTLALRFAQDMANREGCALDVAIHEPSRGGDNRNHHAHIMRTTRKVEAHGLGEKLDTERSGRNRKADLAAWRHRWADFANEALASAGQRSRVDHRSLREQGFNREAGYHLGPAATGYERRTNLASEVRISMKSVASERLSRVESARELERQATALNESIIDTRRQLRHAIDERDAQCRMAVRQGDGGLFARAKKLLLDVSNVTETRKKAAPGNWATNGRGMGKDVRSHEADAAAMSVHAQLRAQSQRIAKARADADKKAAEARRLQRMLASQSEQVPVDEPQDEFTEPPRRPRMR